MKDNINQSRRNMLKLGSIAVVMMPMAAFAAKNDAMRKAMKYQDKPEADKKCSTCIQFVPGKTASDLGGCKIFAGDTEVAPNGYCSAWAKKA
ncbi:MAG: high-potential iron-sulfur protein [Betaproteobacteria bacterium]